MDIANQPKTDEEPELALLVCPRCAYEMDEEPWQGACPKCLHALDLPSQYAYCRGHNAFTVGQDLIFKVSPKKRKKSLFTKDEMDGLQFYQQAYSSLQVAFQGELAESQRQLGIQMFAAIARVFQQHAIISPLESAYWLTLLREFNIQMEQAALQEKLITTAPRGLDGLVQRWRWRLRLKQLEKGLIELDEKIRFLELRIAFVERPRVRRRVDVDKTSV